MLRVFLTRYHSNILSQIVQNIFFTMEFERQSILTSSPLSNLIFSSSISSLRILRCKRVRSEIINGIGGTFSSRCLSFDRREFDFFKIVILSSKQSIRTLIGLGLSRFISISGVLSCLM